MGGRSLRQQKKPRKAGLLLATGGPAGRSAFACAPLEAALGAPRTASGGPLGSAGLGNPGGLGVGVRAPDYQQFSDVLHGRCIQTLANFGQKGFAQLTLVTVDANLDQFVRLQAGFDLFQHRIGKTVLADADDRVEAVGAGAQGAALVGGQLNHW